MTEVSPEKWAEQYRTVRGNYESLTQRLHALIVDLLSDAGIEVIQIEARAKDISSFQEKIARKGAKYRDPLTEITDLVGLRIITYYLEDVARVGKILKREFNIDEANSVDKSADLDADRFGYTSVHYIATLSSDRGSLVEWKQYADIKVEIQVRTALQHAWAAVNHKLDYKSSKEVPKAIRRRLFRLNALFELADEQFSELRDARLQVETEYAEDVREGQFDLPVDEASLHAYLQAGDRKDRIIRLVADSGAKVVMPDEKRSARDRKDLVQYLNKIGISTIKQLDDYLVKEIFPMQLAGTNFLEDAAGLEDWLTVLIMYDQQVDRETYSKFYEPSSYDENAALFHVWQERKRAIR